MFRTAADLKMFRFVGNSYTDWIIGYQHRRISQTFYNLFAACDGPPVGNDVLVELLSFVLKLTIVVSLSGLDETNKDPKNGTNILNARALTEIYHCLEVHAADFVEGDYRKPRWSNGTEMSEDEANEFRGTRLPWNR